MLGYLFKIVTLNLYCAPKSLWVLIKFRFLCLTLTEFKCFWHGGIEICATFNKNVERFLFK